MADNLTDIELKVLNGVIDCKTNIEIAEDIGYSERQVYRIIGRLFRRYRVNRKIELVKYYIISQNYEKKMSET